MSTRQPARARAGEMGGDQQLVRMTELFTTEMRDLKLEIQKLSVNVAGMPTRSEQDMALSQRVSVDAYNIGHRALEEELRATKRELASDIDALKATVTEMRTKQDASLARLAPWVAIGVALVSIYLQTR